MDLILKSAEGYKILKCAQLVENVDTFNNTLYKSEGCVTPG